jgi:hypothetical protein
VPLWATLSDRDKMTRRRALHAVVVVTAAAAAASAAAAPAAAPCFGLLNSTFRFEEACYTVLHNGTGGLSLREYPAKSAAGTDRRKCV